MEGSNPDPQAPPPGDPETQAEDQPQAEGGTVEKTSDHQNFQTATGAAGSDQVQEQVDAENTKGYKGETPDPTPNSHYAVSGAIADAPTPETSQELRKEALSAVQGEGKLAGG